MLRTLLLSLTLASVLPAHAADDLEAGDPVAAALAQARERRAPVLVDFTAPWCYSCYYMAKNVLTGPEWEQARRDSVVVELDADSPVGARYMAQWRVKAMPTYLLFDAQGQELGRILGEQTRKDFYQWLATARARDNPLDALQGQVTDGSARSVAAGREVLRTYHARYDAAGGLAWHGALKPAARQALAQDQAAASWLARLKLQQAAQAKDAAACSAAAPAVFAADLGCERPYEVSKVLACTEGAPAAPRKALLATQAPPLQALLEQRVLGKSRCADERSIVLATADVYAALGDPVAEQRALAHAIDDVRQRIGGKLGKDRNLADNLRVYLERAGRLPELEILLAELLQAYPDDYVYAYRYGKVLAQQGKHAQALPLYERSMAQVYGSNRLRTAELYAKSLHAVNRTAEARKVLSDALKASGVAFPEDAAKVKALLQQLPPAST